MQQAQDVRKPTRKEKIAQGLEKPQGNKKARRAAERKAAKKQRITATLKNQPGSPRKFRLVLDQIRDESVEEALAILKLSDKKAARPLYKLVMSAIANYNDKHPDERVEEDMLYVKQAMADESFTLKRIQPRAQGRAFRIRKRYSRVFIELGLIDELEDEAVAAE
jgi:large subunit ribosomal protein L22